MNVILWENDKFTLTSNLYVIGKDEESGEQKVIFATQCSHRPSDNLSLFCNFIMQYGVQAFTYTGAMSDNFKSKINTALKSYYGKTEPIEFAKV